MGTNPYEPPSVAGTGDHSSPVYAMRGALSDPVLAYTANDNLELHSVVTWLHSGGVRAYAVEGNSGASLYVFGTISQFHKPQVFVDKSDLEEAGELLRQFEDKRKARHKVIDGAPSITSHCDECGATSDFPASQDGTTQNCPKCNEYMDVGSLNWPADCDFENVEMELKEPENADDAIDAAKKLDQIGDWGAAIVAYRTVSDRWPEHTTYIANCIAVVQCKIDGTQ